MFRLCDECVDLSVPINTGPLLNQSWNEIKAFSTTQGRGRVDVNHLEKDQLTLYRKSDFPEEFNLHRGFLQPLSTNHSPNSPAMHAGEVEEVIVLVGVDVGDGLI